MKQKSYFFLGLFLFNLSCLSLYGQTKEQLAKGYNFIETQTYSAEENAVLLKLYKGLRVVDVCDGMDFVGLKNTGLVDPEIHPQWVDTEKMSHAFQGIAVTCRYVPTQRLDRPGPGEDFKKWYRDFYNVYSPAKFQDVLFEGAVLVRDDVSVNEASGIGSNNILSWVAKGMVGVVTDANSRDVDEITLQKVPLYLRSVGRGIRSGRSELESVNRPVEIGGVLVCPGDVVVADGDGVIVVPRSVAREVAEFAHEVMAGDKAGRKKLYEHLGIPIDKTVK